MRNMDQHELIQFSFLSDSFRQEGNITTLLVPDVCVAIRCLQKGKRCTSQVGVPICWGGESHCGKGFLLDASNATLVLKLALWTLWHMEEPGNKCWWHDDAAWCSSYFWVLWTKCESKIKYKKNMERRASKAPKWTTAQCLGSAGYCVSLEHLELGKGKKLIYLNAI